MATERRTTPWFTDRSGWVRCRMLRGVLVVHTKTLDLERSWRDSEDPWHRRWARARLRRELKR